MDIVLTPKEQGEFSGATCSECGALFLFSPDATDDERFQAALNHHCSDEVQDE